jgi:hypothetical protein
MPVPTLQYLALEACGKSAAMVFLSTTGTEEKKYRQIIQICNSLHELPCVLADDVTSVMLRQLESQWIDLEWPDETMQMIAISVIHPKVSALDISLCSNIGKCVMNAIINCSSLVQRFPNYNALSGRKLRKFICKLNCDDQILDALKFCTDIEYLDVRKSWEVGDKSIGTLLGLNKLKYLNIDGTSISQKGLSELLKEIRNKKAIYPLCAFYCSKISTDQLRLLVEFTNLTHIGMEVSICNMSALKYLKYLKSVHLRDGRFSSLQETFQDIGGKLCEIRLEEVEQVDIKFIAETFHKLEFLVLTNCSYRSLTPSGTLEHLPAFKELQKLELYNVESEVLLYLLQACCNLIEVKVDTDVQLEESFNQIPGIGCLKTLEKFILYTRMNRILPKFITEELFRNCRNLRVFKNVGIEREGINAESLKEEMEDKYPLISVTVITTKWPFLGFNELDNPE